MKPQNIFQRWMKDPEKAEKLYIAYYITMILLNLAIAFGVIMFLYFWWRR